MTNFDYLNHLLSIQLLVRKQYGCSLFFDNLIIIMKVYWLIDLYSDCKYLFDLIIHLHLNYDFIWYLKSHINVGFRKDSEPKVGSKYQSMNWNLFFYEGQTTSYLLTDRLIKLNISNVLKSKPYLTNFYLSLSYAYQTKREFPSFDVRKIKEFYSQVNTYLMQLSQR